LIYTFSALVENIRQIDRGVKRWSENDRELKGWTA
jgi:hypothetical protein